MGVTVTYYSIAATTQNKSLDAGGAYAEMFIEKSLF